MQGKGLRVRVALRSIVGFPLFVLFGCGDATSYRLGGPKLPETPSICQEPLELIHGWTSSLAPIPARPGYPCHSTLLDRAGLWAKEGTVYFSTTDALCARDVAGLRQVAEWAPPGHGGDLPQALWLEGDRFVYAGVLSVRQVSIDGGVWTDLAEIPQGHRTAYALHSEQLYWAVEARGLGASDVERLRLSDGTVEGISRNFGTHDSVGNVVVSEKVDTILVTEDRVEYRDQGGRFWRTPLPPESAPTQSSLPDVRALLAADADASYVAAAKSPGAPITPLNFVRVGRDGSVTPAWSESIGLLDPTAATVVENEVYVGGRISFADGVPYHAIARVSRDGASPKLIGCGSRPGFVFVRQIAFDAEGVYAMLMGSTSNEWAIARFPR